MRNEDGSTQNWLKGKLQSWTELVRKYNGIKQVAVTTMIKDQKSVRRSSYVTIVFREEKDAQIAIEEYVEPMVMMSLFNLSNRIGDDRDVTYYST